MCRGSYLSICWNFGLRTICVCLLLYFLIHTVIKNERTCWVWDPEKRSLANVSCNNNFHSLLVFDTNNMHMIDYLFLLLLMTEILQKEHNLGKSPSLIIILSPIPPLSSFPDGGLCYITNRYPEVPYLH